MKEKIRPIQRNWLKRFGHLVSKDRMTSTVIFFTGHICQKAESRKVRKGNRSKEFFSHFGFRSIFTWSFFLLEIRLFQRNRLNELLDQSFRFKDSIPCNSI